MSNCVSLKITSRSQKPMMKFGQLIFRKIIKIVATICEILRLKCTKFDFGWGPTSKKGGGAKGKVIKKGKAGRGEEGKGKGREEKGVKGPGPPSVSLNFPLD